MNIEFFFIVLFLFVFGACVGSFVNVLVDRNFRILTIFSSRSICEKCKKTLQWYDLIPLLSYLLLRGKCRHCRADIPLRLLIVELIAGLLFVVVYLSVSTSLFFVLLSLILSSVLLALFFIDFEHRVLPDYLLVILAAVSVIFVVASSGWMSLLYNVGAGGALFLFFLLLFVGTKGKGIGFGDVKFSFVIGVLLGIFSGVLALYIAFVSGAIVSVLLIVLKKKKLRGSTIPFGPFLVFGTLSMLLFSEWIYFLLSTIYK